MFCCLFRPSQRPEEEGGPLLPLSFDEMFFYRSNLKLNEHEKKTVIEILQYLQENGFTISESDVVYGNRAGQYWPALIKEGYHCHESFIIGKRSNFILGKWPLMSYLGPLDAAVRIEALRDKMPAVKSEHFGHF